MLLLIYICVSHHANHCVHTFVFPPALLVTATAGTATFGVCYEIPVEKEQIAVSHGTKDTGKRITWNCFLLRFKLFIFSSLFSNTKCRTVLHQQQKRFESCKERQDRDGICCLLVLLNASLYEWSTTWWDQWFEHHVLLSLKETLLCILGREISDVICY